MTDLGQSFTEALQKEEEKDLAAQNKWVRRDIEKAVRQLNKISGSIEKEIKDRISYMNETSKIKRYFNKYRRTSKHMVKDILIQADRDAPFSEVKEGILASAEFKALNEKCAKMGFSVFFNHTFSSKSSYECRFYIAINAEEKLGAKTSLTPDP